MKNSPLPAALLLAGLSLLTGCNAAHFEYPLYKPGAKAHGKALPIRVAIAYPEEGRSAPNRDADIEPIVSSQCGELPTYISPRLEISRGLLEELRASGAFEAVHWAPESSDGYDLVAAMKLLDGGKRFESDRCPAMLGPWSWELVVADQSGRELERLRLTMPKTKLFSWSPVEKFRKDEQVFMAKAAAPILAAAERLAAGTPDIAAARSIACVDKRDPGLKALRERIAAAPGADPGLEREYLLRLGAVESARLLEEKTIEAHQALDDRAWSDIQEQLGRQLKDLGDSVRRTLAQSFSLLFDGISGMQSLGALRSPLLESAAAAARGDMARLVSSPGGAQTLLGSIPKDLLPGKLKRLSEDAAFGVELSNKLQGVLLSPVPGAAPAQVLPAPAEPGGCSKDTDCKGERICVRRECVDPSLRQSPR
ncbi:MAG: hypothetical protein WCU88_05025 [Elusimicrobiota bacterium]|jgi:hypothetical protein